MKKIFQKIGEAIEFVVMWIAWVFVMFILGEDEDTPYDGCDTGRDG